jgi:hypothetical protein
MRFSLIIKAWRWAALLWFVLPASAQVVPPIGELFASGANGSNSALEPAGSGMSVYSGSDLAAGIAPATLKLARGGQVRICPHSGLNVTSGNQGFMLATGAGAIEIDYELAQHAADVIITPDFNVTLSGPGTFHFALGVTRQGDTCVKPLAGNMAGATFSELLGTGIYKSQPNRSIIFRGGKLEAPLDFAGDCGCPPPAPVVEAEAQPSPTPVPAKDSIPSETVAVADSAPTASLPPEKPGQVHVQVDTPFVFSGRPAPGGPYSVAKVPVSSLPNIYFLQEKVDPVVLLQKLPDVSPKADIAAAPTPQEKPKEKKGLFGRVKGFFGSLFHR